MRRVFMTMALIAAPGWCQSKQAEQEQLIRQAQEQAEMVRAAAQTQKLVPLKYIDPMAVQMLLRNFGVLVTSDRQLRVVALTGRKAAVDTAEAAIKQLDVPGAAQKDVDLTVFFIVGKDDNTATGGAIPQELQGTVAALKQTFPYKTYELLDALSLRSRAGSGASTTGQLTTNRLTGFSVGSVNVEGDGNMIRIERLHAGLRVLIGMRDKNEFVNVSSIDTDMVDVKEGQKLVVGRSSLEGPGKALFLVLIARVAQ